MSFSQLSTCLASLSTTTVFPASPLANALHLTECLRLLSVPSYKTTRTLFMWLDSVFSTAIGRMLLTVRTISNPRRPFAHASAYPCQHSLRPSLILILSATYDTVLFGMFLHAHLYYMFHGSCYIQTAHMPYRRLLHIPCISTCLRCRYNLAPEQAKCGNMWCFCAQVFTKLCNSHCRALNKFKNSTWIV